MSQANGMRLWAGVTAAAALAVSLLDAALLERKEGLFRGGFLAVDSLESVWQRLAFGVASLASDAALAGLLAALALWLGRRFGLHRRAARALAFVSAAGPLVVADVFRYELARHVGDAMDLSLMFDLVGRRPSEFLAVAGPHLLTPVVLLLAGVLATLILVFWIHRRAVRTSGPADVGTTGWKPPLTLLIAGTVVLGAARVSSTALDNGLRRKPSGDWLGQTITVLTDVDRDGYGLLGRPPDPAPFDSRVYPFAIEVPGNGIDENGVGGDLPPKWPAYVEPPSAAPRFTRRPPVVLIVLESFRADVVGSTANGRPVTPVLDALARKGISLDRAYSHNGYTAQSRFHLMSGSLAGLRGGTTLVDDFKANGYEVAYVSGQDESFGEPRFQVGFDRADYRYDARQTPERRYSTFSTAGSLAVPYDVVADQVRQFLARRNPTKPAFLYVNFHDTHFPYHHAGIRPLVSGRVLPRAEISPERSAELHEMYANTAANVDAAIGEMLGAVERALGESPAIVVTADHGESLYEEGFLGHGYALNEVQTRVPLIVTGLALRLSRPFGQADLRDAIRRALENDERQGAPASVEERPAEQPLVQYLGSLNRPRQVSLRIAGARVLHDFRTGKARIDEQPWQEPADLSPSMRDRWLDLVRTWEAMRLAQTDAQDSR